MEKLKVNREIHWALKDLLGRAGEEYTKDNVLNMHYEAIHIHGKEWSGAKWKYLNELSMEQMAQAMYIGYEIESTPEEKVMEFFDHIHDKYRQKEITDSEMVSAQTAILKTLELLKIKIVGLN